MHDSLFYAILILVIKMELPKRKRIRLEKYDYNQSGAYFITICTKNRQPLLSTIHVGTGVLDGPKNRLSAYGIVADQQIRTMNDLYQNLSVDNYVIMPNHIHLLIQIHPVENGPSETPVPTPQNSIISRFISTFKRFCNQAYGQNIWQPRSYDHIVRDKDDYREIWEYIDNNPLKWQLDRFFQE